MTNMPSPKTEFHLPEDPATCFKHCASAMVSEEAIEEMKETRPTFKELKSIERLRREILFRGELPFWRILFFLEWDMLERHLHRCSRVDNCRSVHCHPRLRSHVRLRPGGSRRYGKDQHQCFRRIPLLLPRSLRQPNEREIPRNVWFFQGLLWKDPRCSRFGTDPAPNRFGQ